MTSYRSTAKFEPFQVSDETRPRLENYGISESPPGTLEGFWVVVQQDTDMVNAVVSAEDFPKMFEECPEADPAPDNTETPVVDSP